MSISRHDGEDPQAFMNRCENDESMKAEYPDGDRRRDVCISKAVENMGHIEAADFQIEHACEVEAKRDLERAANKKTYKYKDPKTGEVYEFDRRGLYRRNNRILIPA